MNKPPETNQPQQFASVNKNQNLERGARSEERGTTEINSSTVKTSSDATYINLNPKSLTLDTKNKPTHEQFEIRKNKRQSLLDQNIEPYILRVGEITDIREIRNNPKYQSLEAGAETSDLVTIVGRMMFKREAGRLCFASLQGRDDIRLQIMLSEKEVGKDSLTEFKSLTDLGDFIWAHGKIISSKTGELSVLVDQWKIASKSLRPLPILHKDLSEEEKIRRRFLEFITSKPTVELMEIRSKVVNSLRENFFRREYIELDTPMIQAVHGGAAAKPFETKINAFDLDVYLRISPELFLKRAIVGGLERVFEINRVFRNEGADSSHSPEFTMLESYEAYSDYHGVAALTKNLVQQAALDTFGTLSLELRDGERLELDGEWKQIDFYDTVSQQIGEPITPETSVEHLLELCHKVGLDKEFVKGSKKHLATHGKLVELLFEHYMEGQLNQPVFVYDFPEDTSPLVSPHCGKPGVVEKWDLYIRGYELATGYSELVDPVIQRERLTKQSKLAAQGDEDAMQLDEEFLEALEYGMPPTGGMGMGIDRLVMVLTGVKSIRDTIPFPLVKPR
ncbi:MAG: lysine--tRNA ligase [Bifidobacteriaceae bacterium]|nr:lysine--tRNA ligase [Bifidobacteriaceae bacterium]